MMDCKQIETVLADYLGGELSDQSRRDVEAHLLSCDRCAREIDGLQHTLQTLEQFDTVTPAEARRRTSDLYVAQRVAYSKRIVFALLRTAAVLLVGVFLGRMSLSQGDHATVDPTAPKPIAVQTDRASIHPAWVALARKQRHNASGLTNALRTLAEGHY